MSKIKSTLPEDFDVTDPRDNSGALGLKDEPTIIDFALKDLWSATKSLEQNASQVALGDLEEIYEAIKTLKSVAKATESPF